MIASLFFLSPKPEIPPILPQPQQVVVGAGFLRLQSAVVVAPKALSGEAQAAKVVLRDARVQKGASQRILLKLGRTKFRGTEAYDLNVGARDITIVGASPHGVFNGIQSLRQIIRGREVPRVAVHDAPRFQWRAFMLDASRHFFSVEDTKHFIDTASRYKLNTFHWHLSDDGGWRVEIKRYPELTRRGAFRVPADGSYREYAGMDFPPVENRPATYGGYYTQAQIRDIVAYATKRHVTIVPELDMPGHSLAACVSYPWLVCSPDLRDAWKKAESFEFLNILCAGKETTYEFAQNVMDEVLDLFPSKVIHIGGDEVDKFLWNRCPDCKAKMRELGIERPEKLESYFIGRMEKYLNSRGRTIIGWDEITEGGVEPSAMVMSWRGTEGGIAAAKLGHRVVMSPVGDVYLNTPEPELSLEKVYGFNPVPGEIPAPMRKFVIGGEACLWTETISGRGNVERHLFPRLLALSQVLWTPSRESFADFGKRLSANYASLLESAPGAYVPPVEFEFPLLSPEQPARINSPTVPGTVIRYELNGSPTVSSPIYKQPIKLAPGTSASAAIFSGDRQVTAAYTVHCVSLTPAVLASTRPGLSQSVYSGKFDSVPDFRPLEADRTETVLQIQAIDPDREWYAQRIRGYFVAPKDGVYEFILSADDGATFALAGFKLVDNDGLHGFLEKRAKVRLSKGAYPIEVSYIQAREAARLSLQYSLDGSRPLDVAPQCVSPAP